MIQTSATSTYLKLLSSILNHRLPLSTSGQCGLPLNTGFIVGGEQAARGEFPFTSLLGYWSDKRRRIEYKCGGTLINR